MSANELSALAGIGLSLLFSYVPKLNTKFAALAPEYKRLIMLGLLAVFAFGVYGVSCLGWFETGITCDQSGIISLVKAFVAAAVANQAAFALTPQTQAVRSAKFQ